MTGKRRARFRISLAVLAVLLIPPTGFFTWRWETSNFGALQAGRIYRSAQMTSPTIARTIRDNGIKTVLNLRGVNPSEPWYLDEREAATSEGATLMDISMSSCQWMSKAQLKTVVRVLDTCDYPLMIHCQWGAERTGLISAFSELLRPGSTVNDAKDQFSIYYMFVPVKDGKIMAAHLDQYEQWLKQKQLDHSPDRFRTWVNDGFVPQRPGRDDWPYDPYPLVVISRPSGKTSAENPTLEKTSPPIALKKDVQTDARPR